MTNWDDNTDEVVTYCIDTPGSEVPQSFWIEENRKTERFRVRYFHNGAQVGEPMYAFDWSGVDALLRLLDGSRKGVA